jgi:DNA polymerase IV (DinB-like DNA polymerase)
MRILKNNADKFEQGGIDEAYLDISSRVRDFDDAGEYARRLMEEVREREKLTCSIGVAPNKLVAKIASDYRKPYGLTVVREEDLRRFLSPMPARKIPGVGPKTESRLKELKIETIGDLAAADPEMLARLFGVWGARLHEYASGIDRSEVVEEYQIKSIGREVTFEEDTDDEDAILSALDELAEEVYRELIDNAFQFKTVTIKVRYEHFDTRTRAKSLLFPTDDPDILKNTAKRLMSSHLRGNKKIRLIGLRASNLVRGSKRDQM